MTFDEFLTYAVSDTVNHGDGSPAPKTRPCPDCDGKGVIWVHVCTEDRGCRESHCPVGQHCMQCLGTGRVS